jgi:predicted nucleic acid-binding protein
LKNNIYLDVNVIVSIINNELNSVADCLKILSLADNPKFKVHISPITLAIGFYFAEKKKGREGANKIIQLLSTKLIILPNKDTHVHKVFLDSRIHDFEDGLHYQAAIEAKCNAIITYNKADFYYSDIAIATPKEYLKDTFC